jgi:Tol biopolymer transport system component
MSKIKWFGPVVAVVLLALAMGVPSLSAKGKPGGGGGGGGSDTLTNPAFVYGESYDAGLYLTTVDGTATVRLTKPPRKGWDRSPAVWSPDGTLIAFLRAPEAGKTYSDLYTIRPDGSGLTFIRAQGGGPLTWSADGSSIVFPSSKSLWSVNVATGDLQLVFDHLSLPDVSDSVGDPDFSPDFDPGTPGYQGALAFSASTGVDETYERYQMDIWLLEVQIDPTGQLTTGALMNLTDSPSWDEKPAWSPDGAYLAYTTLQETLDSDLVVVNLATNFAWDVTTGIHSISQPDWSPDGEYLAFSAWHQPNQGGAAATHDIFRVSPWDLVAVVVNVTQTDSGNDRELNPRWNPKWTNDISP